MDIHCSRCPQKDTRQVDQDIVSQKKVTQGPPLPIGNPPLRKMVRPVVQHVTALAERAQVTHPVVGGVAIEVGRREHDARGAHPGRLDQVGPAGGPAAAVPPSRGRRVEPAPVRQTTKPGQMRPAAPLAFAARPLETHLPTELAPMQGMGVR